MAYTLIILAGGKSTRFGQDKAMLAINGVRLIDLVVEKCGPLFSEILVAGRNPENFDVPGVRAVPDLYPNAGPLGGIHAGLRASSNETCFVTACDMPNLNLPTVKKLLEAAADYDVALLKTGEDVQPLFAVYKKSLLPDVERLLEEKTYRVLRLYDTARVFYLETPDGSKRPENTPTFNINYSEDYEMFLKSVPPVLSVVGFSDSGKTTYLEKLIAALKSRGLRLGVIKHDAHSFDIDIPGKDSWRLTQAGADITVVASPAKIAMIEKWRGEEDLYRIAGRLVGKVDLVLSEGYKRDKAPKIEIRRAAKSRDAFCSDDELFAVATDYATASETTAPILPLDDAEPMADLIMRYLEDGDSGKA